MTDQVHLLTKNYRVHCEVFKVLLGHVTTGHPTLEDAKKTIKLHSIFYRSNGHFIKKLESHKKTMWLFSNNTNVKEKK